MEDNERESLESRRHHAARAAGRRRGRGGCDQPRSAARGLRRRGRGRGAGPEEPAGTEAAPPATPPATETVPAGGGGEVDTMAWVINGEAVSMDYALAYDFNTNAATTNICEPLLRFSPEGQLEPNLAEAWEQPDPTTFVITLRSGVKFHDGTDMTAEDVAFSLNRHRDPELGSYLATFHERVEDISGDRRSRGDGDAQRARLDLPLRAGARTPPRSHRRPGSRRTQPTSARPRPE